MAVLARSILVTGSNRGIGLELVKQLVEMSDPPEHIFATCRDPDGPRGRALHDLADKHPSIHVVQLEVENQSSVKAAVAIVQSYLEGKGLNLLINNAGVDTYDTLQTVEQQEMLCTFNINVVGPILVVKAALNMVTACLAVELKGDEILCIAIHPGWVKTDMGTEKAPLTVQHSVQGILKVLASLSSSSTGTLLDWEGRRIFW
ncbi:C-signal isoform X8 [Pogona vitticeps]|uniref:C-signal-like isoform X3 n=1 Tax=Pogona vitticeps TaxID=103695 RepID=A0A6J0VCE7_9SAUR